MGFIREFDDLAQTIANPPADRPIARGVGNLGRRMCDAISARPDLYAPTFLQWPLLAVCDPYFDQEGIDPPAEQPAPYPGGQCEGVQYKFTWEQRTTGGGGYVWIGPVDSFGAGPLTVCADPTQSGDPVINPGLFFNNAELLNGSGQRIARLALGNTDDPQGWRLISVNRTDGEPDECGDQAPTLVPGPNPAPFPGPLPPGTGPQFDIRGNPIFVLPPVLNVTPTLNVQIGPGEINLGSGTGNVGPGGPIPAEPIDGVGGAGPGGAGGNGGGDNDFGDPPEGERWVGCCVNITTSPLGQGIIPASVPESIYPNIVGNVRLIFKPGTAPEAYDTPIQNRQKTTCIWEPVRGLNPTGVRVNLNPGFAYSVTPYSVPIGD